MSKAGFRVLDSDLHVIEPSDLYDHDLDPAFRDRTPRPTATRGGSRASGQSASTHSRVRSAGAGSTRRSAPPPC